MQPLIPTVTLAFSFLVGCAGTGAVPPPGPDHPGNPTATASPVPEPSQTLAFDDAGRPREEAAASAEGPAMSPGGAGHAGHGTTGTSRPATSQAATLYACPMHKEVTSTNPNDRCPKCGMKINKPVKVSATQPLTRPSAPQPHDHAAGGPK